MAVVVETTLGDFTVDLFTERRPQTCKNFLKLCKIKYYNFCLFHSVQANFLAQTGDPTGTGLGGESIFGVLYGDNARYFEAETMPKMKYSKTGLLSMVNVGNNMLGSQFFVTLGSDLQSLDEHCIFGEVTEGLDILLKLNEAICDTTHRPYQDIRITHTIILEDPFEDPSGLAVPDMSPEPSQMTLQNGRIGADEEIDETVGLTTAEVEEMKQDREAKARATILEIVGDLPDAEMAPPENVLFVCKLNPVTNDDDLEIIFSRFGKVKSCEVIRDRQTGDSLQYAFVEFEDQKACEEAYFKMDNVLIDDRRIHVDFSQSVAKMRWRGKGKGVEYFDKEPAGKERSGSYRNDDNRSHSSSSRRDHYQDRDRRNRTRDTDEKRRWRDGDSDRYKSERDWRSQDTRNSSSNSSRRRGGSPRRRDDDSWREDSSKRLEDTRRYDDSKRREDSRKKESSSSHRRDSRRRDDKRSNDRRKDYDKRDSEKKKENQTNSSEKYNCDRSEKQDKPPDSHAQDCSPADVAVKNEHTNDNSGDVNIIPGSKESSGRMPSSQSEREGKADKCNGDDSQPDNVSAHKDEENARLSQESHVDQESRDHCSPGKKSETDKKLKNRKRKSSESRSRSRKRRKSTTSSEDSSSNSSDSSDSSSSSESSGYKHKGRHKMIVAKKYYQGGKLVKEVKKKHRGQTSDSDSFSEDSSDSDYLRKKKKNKKHKKVIVKVIKKKRKRHRSSDESNSGSSSSEDSNHEKTKKKKRKETDRNLKKKSRNSSKKRKRRRNIDSSNSSDSEVSVKKKASIKKSKDEQDRRLTET